MMQGAGCGMPNQRQKQYQQQRVIQAADNVFDYRTQKIAAVHENSMITKDKQETRRRMMRLDVQLVQLDQILQRGCLHGTQHNTVFAHKFALFGIQQHTITVVSAHDC